MFYGRQPQIVEHLNRGCRSLMALNTNFKPLTACYKETEGGSGWLYIIFQSLFLLHKFPLSEKRPEVSKSGLDPQNVKERSLDRPLTKGTRIILHIYMSYIRDAKS